MVREIKEVNRFRLIDLLASVDVQTLVRVREFDNGEWVYDSGVLNLGSAIVDVVKSGYYDAEGFKVRTCVYSHDKADFDTDILKRRYGIYPTNGYYSCIEIVVEW